MAIRLRSRSLVRWAALGALVIGSATWRDALAAPPQPPGLTPVPVALTAFCAPLAFGAADGTIGTSPSLRKTRVAFSFRLQDPSHTAADEIANIKRVEVCLVHNNVEQCAPPGVLDERVYYDKAAGWGTPMSPAWVVDDPNARYAWLVDHQPAFDLPASLWDWAVELPPGVEPPSFRVKVNGKWSFADNGSCAGASVVAKGPTSGLPVVATSPVTAGLTDVCRLGSRLNYLDGPVVGTTSALFDVCLTKDRAQYFADAMDALNRSHRDILEGGSATPHDTSRNGPGHKDWVFVVPKEGGGGISLGQAFIIPAHSVNAISLSPTCPSGWCGWGRGVQLPLSLVAHEYNHNWGSQWYLDGTPAERAVMAHLDTAGNVLGEGNCTSIQDSLCYEEWAEAPPDPAVPGKRMCFSADRGRAEVGAPHAQGHMGVSYFATHPGAPALYEYGDNYSNGPFLHYAYEQFSRSRNTSTAHPGGTNSSQGAQPANSLSGRRSSEGEDLLGRIFEHIRTNGTLTSTHGALLDGALKANVGRSLRDMLFDFHTALYLKDYNLMAAPPGFTAEERFHFQWAGPYNFGIPFSDLLPLPVPPDLYDAAANGGNRSSGMARAFRQLDSYALCPSSVCQVGYAPGATIQGETTLQRYGTTAYSIHPTAPGIVQFTAQSFAGVDAPAFRAFRIQRSTVGGSTHLTPESVCAGAPGTSPPSYLCQPTSTPNGGWSLSLLIPTDTATDEVIVIPGTGASGSGFGWAFGPPQPYLTIVTPTANLPALVGDHDNPLSFTVALSAWDSPGKPHSFTKGDVKLTVPGCAAAAMGGSCEVPAAAITAAINGPVSTTLSVTLPPAMLPVVAPGAPIFLPLRAQVGPLQAENAAALRAEGGPPTEAIVFVIDASGSMADNAKIDAARLVAKALLDWMLPVAGAATRRVGIVSFNGGSKVELPPYLLTPFTRPQYDQVLDAVTPNGSTSLGNGLFRAGALLASNFDPLPVAEWPSKQSIIVLSDGANTAPDTPARYYADGAGPSDAGGDPGGAWGTTQPIGLAQRKGAGCGPGGTTACPIPRVSAVAIGQDADVGELGELTAQGAGVLTFVDDSPTLTFALKVNAFALGMSEALDHTLGFQRVQTKTMHGPIATEAPAVKVGAGVQVLRVAMISGGVPTTGLSLRSPSGQVLAPTTETPTSTVWLVLAPEEGTWTMVQNPGPVPSPAETASLYFSASVLGGPPVFAPAFVKPLPPFNLPPLLLGGDPYRIELGAALDPDCSYTASVRTPSGEAHPVAMRAASGSTGLTGVFRETWQPGLYESLVSLDCAGRRTEVRATAVFSMLDADADGLSDAWEIQHGLSPRDATDAVQDLDGDGLSNLAEFRAGTSPMRSDTDGGGESDASELARGADPNDPADDGVGTPEIVVLAGTSATFVSVAAFGPAVVERSTAGGPFIAIRGVPTASGLDMVDYDVQNDVVVCYRAKVVGVAESGWSQTRCARPATDPTPPEIDATRVDGLVRGPWVDITRLAHDPSVPTWARGVVLQAASPSGVRKVRWAFDAFPDESQWQTYRAGLIARTPRATGTLWMQAEDAAGHRSPLTPLPYVQEGLPSVNQALTLEELALASLTADPSAARALLTDSVDMIANVQARSKAELTSCGWSGNESAPFDEQASEDGADVVGSHGPCRGTTIHIVRVLQQVLVKKAAVLDRLDQGKTKQAEQMLEGAIAQEHRLIRWTLRKNVAP